jgi:hypothetical protein
VKPRLAEGGFERAVRAAGFERLVCVANAVAIVHALEEDGRDADGLGMIYQLTFGAVSDEPWFRRVTTLVPDPRHRARFIDRTVDWWWVDDLALRYLTLEGLGELYPAHAGERIFAPSPEGDGGDVLAWLARLPRVRDGTIV